MKKLLMQIGDFGDYHGNGERGEKRCDLVDWGPQLKMVGKTLAHRSLARQNAVIFQSEDE